MKVDGLGGTGVLGHLPAGAAREEKSPSAAGRGSTTWVCMDHLKPPEPPRTEGSWAGGVRRLFVLHDDDDDDEDGVWCQRLGLWGQGESSLLSTGLQSPSFWLT